MQVDNPSVHTRSLHFAAPQWGWETRGTSLYQTRGGGQSWQAIPFGLPAVQSANSGQAIAPTFNSKKEV